MKTNLPAHVKTYNLFCTGWTISEIAIEMAADPQEVARIIGYMVDIEYRCFRGVAG